MRKLFVSLLLLVIPSLLLANAGLSQDAQEGGDSQQPGWYATGSFGYTATGGNSRTNTLAGSIEAGRVGTWTDHKLTDKLSFSTPFNITYTNLPGLVEKLDEHGNVVMIDDDNDPATEPVPELTEAQRVDYTWTNSLMITFF